MSSSLHSKNPSACRARPGARPMAAIFGLFFVLMIADARAANAPPEVSRTVPDAQLVGEAPYQVLGLNVFEATLWAEAGAFAWNRPFALTLTYSRPFSARALASRSVQEMSRRTVITAPDRLRERLQACFADVSAGDRITGVSTSVNSAVFYHNGRRRCMIEHSGFANAFFGIWLDAPDSNRRFRDRLLGAD